MTHDELVEKMLEAQFAKDYPNWRKESSEEVKRFRENMSAVLCVCVEELLGDGRGDPTEVEIVLENRRARNSPPKPKTAQEKIEAILDATFIGPGTNSIVAAKIVAELNLKEQK